MNRLATLLAVLSVLSCAPGARAEEPRDEERAAVVLVADVPGPVFGEVTAYVGQPIRLVLRIRWDEAWFAAHAVPLFHRATDLPIQVLSDAFGDVPGATELAARASDGPSLVLGEAVVRAHTFARDSRFSVVELERRIVPTAVGELRFAPPVLRFAATSRFETDSFGERVPVDRRDVRIEGEWATVRVVPLPSEGKPARFDGLVGRYEVSARAEPTRVAVGATFRLTLEITGDGNLPLVPPPTLDDLPGFHVYGLLVEAVEGGRVVRYDLAALSDATTEVPAIGIAYLDPGPPVAYRVASSMPIPLEVTGGAAGGVSNESGVPWLPAAAGIFLLLGATLLFFFRRRERGLTRVDAARAALQAARTPREQAARFEAFLSEVLPTAPGTTLDLEARLPADLAARVRDTREALDAAAWSADAPPLESSLLLALADDIERSCNSTTHLRPS